MYRLKLRVDNREGDVIGYTRSTGGVSWPVIHRHHGFHTGEEVILVHPRRIRHFSTENLTDCCSFQTQRGTEGQGLSLLTLGLP